MFGSRKSISGKYSIFRKCYFSERKMFLCVWLYFKKFSKKYFLVFGKCYKEKTKPEKQTQHPDWRSTLDWVRRHGASRAPVRRPHHRSQSREAPRCFARSRSTARSREASIAIGAKASSRSRIAIDDAGACERRRLELGACERRGLVPKVLFSLSLSLSLSLRNSFEVKIGTEIHFRSQSLFFLGQRKSISGKFYFPNQPNTRISGNEFPEMIFIQNKHSLNQPQILRV